MSAKAVSEACGKDLLNRFLSGTANNSRFVSVNEKTNLNDLSIEHPWLTREVSPDSNICNNQSNQTDSQKLVVKPDQLIKRRGKLGLVKVNTDLNGVKEFVNKHMCKDIQVRLFCLFCGRLVIFVVVVVFVRFV